MKYYLRQITITRDEELAEPTTIVKKDGKGMIENVLARKAGDEINTIYTVDSHLSCSGRLLNNIDLGKIKNIVKGYIMLFGEEKLNEDKISEFIKKQTDLDISFTFDKISKKYCHPLAEKFPYYSDEIDVTNLAKAQVDVNTL